VMRTTRGARLAAVLLGASLLAAACGSSESSEDSASPTTAGGTETTSAATTAAAAPTTVAGIEGGTVTVGAEQEPDCADWIGSCGGSSWGFWMMNMTTMPRAFNVVKVGEDYTYKPSIVLAEEPKLDTTGAKPKVSYKIDPKAKWSTGDAITSTDFKYTWEQITKGEDIYDTTGYADIEAVDDSDPTTAVVTFSKPYASWKSLFGAGYGIFPSKILAGKDRNAEMKDGYKWSAGPWVIESWEKGVGITLVPNESFFGEKPKLDKIVFKFITDTAAQFQAFKAGEVDMINPQPQIAVVDAIAAGLGDGVESSVNAQTGNAEALWINNAKAPFDVLEVRQAFAYALDRDAIVNRLFGPLGVKTALQSLNPALVSKYAGEDFSVYKKDLKKVEELMTKAGYAKGSDGIWAKGGQKAAFAMRTTAGNKRRELTQEVMIQQLKEAGFEMTTDNIPAGDLFGKEAPAGNFQVALYAQVATSPDPGLCGTQCSKNIPTEANGNVGQNWTRTNVPAADPLLEQVDSELDDAKRVAASKAADKLLAENVVSLPLDPLPNILLWNEKVQNVGDNPIEGPFASAYLWTLAS
jgi:peptide/nickel transport system substrate-binding protein